MTTAATAMRSRERDHLAAHLRLLEDKIADLQHPAASITATAELTVPHLHRLAVEARYVELLAATRRLAELTRAEGRAYVTSELPIAVLEARRRAGKALLKRSGYTGAGGAIYNPEGRCVAPSQRGGWGPFVEGFGSRITFDRNGAQVTARWSLHELTRR